MTYNGFPGCTNSSLENSDICFCSNKLTSSVIDNVVSIENLYFINYILYFSVCCFLVYPVSNLISVAVIIFNIGQTSLLYGKELFND